MCALFKWSRGREIVSRLQLSAETSLNSKAMRQYCSLADHVYLPQLLALYESILKHSSEPFKLHVLAMDDECLRVLSRLGLPHLEMTNLRVFEVLNVNELDTIRASRTWQEYCWTLASQFAEFLMEFDGFNELTYLDADVFVFSDPAPVFAEIGSRSIAISPHRLIPSKQHLAVNGEFNVGWITFKNTPAGRECLSRWAAQCRERCSASVGCGDQKYLDEFIPRHGDEVCVLSKGVNVAPWNIGNWQVTEGPCVDGTPVVTFHYHEYIHGVRWTNYALRIEDIGLLYKPYIAAVIAAKERIAELVPHDANRQNEKVNCI